MPVQEVTASDIILYKMLMQSGSCLNLSTVTIMWLLPAYIVQKAERKTMEMQD